MRRLTIALALALAPGAASAQASADEANAIYRAFLADYLREGGGANLGDQTMPLYLSAAGIGCTEGLALETQAAAATHVLPADLSPSVTLVDADAQRQRFARFEDGLLRLSEVIFDRSRTHAIFEYSYECGAFCGHGATVIYERTETGWKASARACGSWDS